MNQIKTSTSNPLPTQRKWYTAPEDAQPVSPEKRAQFLTNVYALLTASLIIACLGGATGLFLGLIKPTHFLMLVIAEFIILMVTLCVRKTYGINFIALFSFTFTSGMTTSPALAAVIAAGKGILIAYSAALTIIVFAALSCYVLYSKHDFSWLGGILISLLLVMLIISVVSWLVPHTHGIVSGLIISSALIMLFVGFVLFDTSNMLYFYQPDDYVEATLNLYLDILNLFMDFLRFLLHATEGMDLDALDFFDWF